MDFPTIYSRTGSFLILGILGGIFHCFFFLQIFIEHTQVNSEDLDHATSDLVSSVCLFPTKRTLGIYGLKAGSQTPCRYAKNEPKVMIIFLSIAFNICSGC